MGHHFSHSVPEEDGERWLWKPAEEGMEAVRASPTQPLGHCFSSFLVLIRKSPGFLGQVQEAELTKGINLELVSAHVKKGMETFNLNMSYGKYP